MGRHARDIFGFIFLVEMMMLLLFRHNNILNMIESNRIECPSGRLRRSSHTDHTIGHELNSSRAEYAKFPCNFNVFSCSALIASHMQVRPMCAPLRAVCIVHHVEYHNFHNQLYLYFSLSLK